MTMRTARYIVSILAGLLCVAGLTCCASSSTQAMSAGMSSAQKRGVQRIHKRLQVKANTLGPHETPRKGRQVQWGIDRNPGAQEVRIRGKVGWCPEIKHSFPKVTGVSEVDRPHAIILTAYVRKKMTPGCLGVLALWSKSVKLRQPLRGRPLYDGKPSPPKKRWPRGF